MVGEVGLEPTKAKPADLQSAPFAARDTPPLAVEPHGISGNLQAIRLPAEHLAGRCYGDAPHGCQPEKPGARFAGHDPEKWIPVFGQDHAQTREKEPMTGSVEVTIEARKLGLVARVVLQNAAKLNTLNSHLMLSFVTELEALAKREELRAVVLTGAGEKAFIGGADIFEMATLDAEKAEAFITLVHRSCNALRELPVPVIARVNGYALGAGLEIAAACDLRAASSNAVFGMPEVKVGIPSVVEAALLPGLIGWGRTRELLLWGENIDAQTALACRLVEQVIAPA